MSSRRKRPRTYAIPPRGQHNLRIPSRDALRPANCTCRERVVLATRDAVDVFHEPGCPSTTPITQDPKGE